jgi:pimeloyl-ACP methyl ester carboxylesterase
MQNLKKIALILLRIVVISYLGFALVLFFHQHSMIYHPRRYEPGETTTLPLHAMELDYRTSQGRQAAFFVPPKNGMLRTPQRIWVMFGGNASLALGWGHFLATAPGQNDGYLLVDYPGYGACDGSASPATIEESADKALNELGLKLVLDHAAVEQKLNVIGHSLGCGVALNFCAGHNIRKLILIAPFTSLRDMAGRTVGFPLCYLLLHNFDNRARLAGLAARQNPPSVFLFHGSEDEVIPVAMGRELAAMFPRMITFREVAGAAHNTIIGIAQPEIYEAMEQ